MAELSLQNITKIYDKSIYAAKNITFDIHDKEFAVLVGPSGCGKTTTLRLIAGLEEVDSGKIYIDGQLVNDVSPKDRDIAMVFQNYALYPHMNVYDNMAFGLRMRKYPKAEIQKRVNEAAEILGISDLLRRKPRQLSGGQRQRVAVGRAIVRQPKLFLFDEPLSNLDAKLRVQMRAELSRLHKRFQATIVYVTHDQIEAMTLGEKIIVLKDAEIQQVADPTTLYKHPKNKFVAGFIGSPPMNFFNGLVKKEKEGVVFARQDFTMKLGQRYQEFANRDLVVGIRPTDFSLDSGVSIKVMVDVVEPLGSEIYIHGRWGETVITARLPEMTPPKVGNMFVLKINPERIYGFDAKTEAAIE